LREVLLLLAVLRWMKPVVKSGASFPSAKNKLGELHIDRSFQNLATMEAGGDGR
jgi:hypothetical protein